MKGRVSRHQADRTNQKLYFTRVYCQLAEQCNDAQLHQAHLESAVSHLYGSYLAFLQELASFYGLSLTTPTLETIEAALAKKTQVSPEIERLKRVAAQDFLAEIIQAWQQVLYKPMSVAYTAPDLSKLPVIDVMAQPKIDLTGTVSTDLVRQWRGEMLALIETLREGMIEY